MNDLKRIEGKTIKDIKERSDGKNSFLIINFNEGGKLNITSNPNGDKGVGQLDIEMGELSEEDLQGKRIHNIAEEFDGLNDFIVITFKDGKKMTITSFCSAEDCTATISTHVYSTNNLVSEALYEMYILFENSYSDARNGDYALQNPQYESGIDPENIPDYSQFWAIYSGFYELFLDITDEDELESTYKIILPDSDMDKQAKIALTFFYNIRKEELKDPNFWEKVVGKQLQEHKLNKLKIMKAKLIKEFLNEVSRYEDKWADEQINKHLNKDQSVINYLNALIASGYGRYPDAKIDWEYYDNHRKTIDNHYHVEFDVGDKPGAIVRILPQEPWE